MVNGLHLFRVFLPYQYPKHFTMLFLIHTQMKTEMPCMTHQEQLRVQCLAQSNFNSSTVLNTYQFIFTQCSIQSLHFTPHACMCMWAWVCASEESKYTVAPKIHWIIGERSLRQDDAKMMHRHKSNFIPCLFLTWNLWFDDFWFDKTDYVWSVLEWNQDHFLPFMDWSL